MPKTTRRRRILLILGSVVFTFVLLEVTLRLAGFVFLLQQEKINSASLKKKGEYRILCLGESTTALGAGYSYPRQLEEILNQQYPQIKFTVINRGVPATTSSYIVASLGDYLDKYQPQMVVAMMGVNDSTETFLAEGIEPPQHLIPWIHEFRTFKLIALLGRYLRHKFAELNRDKSGKSLRDIEKQITSHPSSNAYVDLGRGYLFAKDFDRAEKAFVRAIELNPRNYKAYTFLGKYYRQRGEYDRAAECFILANETNPSEDEYKVISYSHLGDCYAFMARYKEAEDIYKKIIKTSSLQPDVYLRLGEVYLVQGRFKEAEEVFEKSIEVDPKGVWGYVRLIYCYRQENRQGDIEAVLKKAIATVPYTPQYQILLAELGYFLMEQGKFEDADNIFKKILELKSQGIGENFLDVRQALVLNNQRQGLRNQGNASTKFNQEGLNYNPATRYNYQKMRNILLKRGVTIVCVQYPLRDIASLKAIVTPGKDVLFVDNNAPFREALAEGRYEDYFYDHFAGDFGHCTPKGNKLLAQNVAQTILGHVKKERLEK